MKLFLLNLIAMLITLSSLHVSLETEINFNDEGTDSLSSLPLLNLKPIRSPNGKSSNESEIFTRSFEEPAILSAVTTLLTIPFLYYLPIYSLHRAKSFFLLI